MGKGDFVQQFHDGSPGIHPLCRLVTCFCKLVYSDVDDQERENLSVSESVLNESHPQSNCLMVEEFKDEFLNQCPTPDEKQ